MYCYMIEQCQQAAQQNRVIFCKNHGNMGPWFVASDTGYIVSGHMAPDAVSLTVVFVSLNEAK